MISGSTKVAVLVLEKEDQLSPRVKELRKKIHDESYVNYAVQRIAQVISRKLVETPEEKF